jgi:hypothetical protein
MAASELGRPLLENIVEGPEDTLEMQRDEDSTLLRYYNYQDLVQQTEQVGEGSTLPSAHPSAHPLVGKPMLGVFYCNRARLCLCPCLPDQRRIRKKLIKRYRGGSLNLLGVEKDPLDCYNVDPDFSLKEWCHKFVHDRRVLTLLVTLAFTGVCVYFNAVMQVVAQHRADALLSGSIPLIPEKGTVPYKSRENLDIPFEARRNLTSIPKLPDVGFDVIPKLGSTLADNWLYVIAGVTFFRFGMTPMRLTIMRRWIFAVGMLFFLRGITIYITLLPNPFYECTRKGWDEGYLDNPFLGGIYVLTGYASTCADVLFSGHTFNTALLAFIWHQYNHVVPLMNGHLVPRSMRACYRKLCCCGTHLVNKKLPRRVRAFEPSARLTPVTLLVWIAAFIEFYLIIATHFHYTVDVFVAFILSIFVWKFYHYYIFHTKRMTPDKPFAIERILVWLESGAEDLAVKASNDEK